MRWLVIITAAVGLLTMAWASDLPDVMSLDSLMKRYGPVEFSHEDHMEVAEDCSFCHHHSEEPVACSECHEPIAVYHYKGSARKTGLGLKGAYHGLCVRCHKDSEAPTGCTDCHAKKGS